jgi:hypothetical protein
MTMRMSLHSVTRTVTSTLALAAAGCLVAGSLSAAVLDRLISDYQPGEASSDILPGAGGRLVYDSGSFTVPDAENVLFIEFEAVGDAHNGSALLMNATVQQGTGPETLCQPLASRTGGGGNTVPGWYNLLKLPKSTTGTNCNDGGGGTGDCHDNAIVLSCCARLAHPDTTARVRLRLATLPAVAPGPPLVHDTVFYEKSTIYVDAVSDPDGPFHPATQCLTHGVP